MFGFPGSRPDPPVEHRRQGTATGLARLTRPGEGPHRPGPNTGLSHGRRRGRVSAAEIRGHREAVMFRSIASVGRERRCRPCPPSLMMSCARWSTTAARTTPAVPVTDAPRTRGRARGSSLTCRRRTDRELSMRTASANRRRRGMGTVGRKRRRLTAERLTSHGARGARCTSLLATPALASAALERRTRRASAIRQRRQDGQGGHRTATLLIGQFGRHDVVRLPREPLGARHQVCPIARELQQLAAPCTARGGCDSGPHSGGVISVGAAPGRPDQFPVNMRIPTGR